MRKFLSLFGTILYCFACLYFFIFALCNGFYQIDKILVRLKLSEHFRFSEQVLFTYSIFTYISIFSCVLLWILYKKGLHLKRGLSIWGLILLLIFNLYAGGFASSLYGNDRLLIVLTSVFSLVMAVALVFQAGLSIYLFKTIGIKALNNDVIN